MTDKVQKIREEVEKLKSNLIYGACSSQIAMVTRCKEEAYDEVLTLLATMQEESVSEDLEEAAMQYAKSMHTNDTLQKIVSLDFKAGAEWQKEQMMANAIDGEVLENYDGKVLEYDDSILDKKLSNCRALDKVKIIIIKKD